MTNPYGQLQPHNQQPQAPQHPQIPQQPPHQDSGRARALFGISTLFAVIALFVTLAGTGGDKAIAGLLFIGFSIVAAVSYNAMNKQ
ncbi:hypothetical protein [Corynebacterium auriscanis]|uniref:hypothetical protein n=1 Tax=Corynebacterium auriscanis TaxID=99807 RepID=UPI0024ADF011|nr:hypothetical protein [Corynebacterium auriscanis]